MMKFAVITPFSRYQFVEVLKNHLRPMGIIWYPIVDKPYDFGEAWIRPYIYNSAGKTYPIWAKLNGFIDNGLEGDKYYSILNDDDFYEPMFFERIRKQNPSESVIMVSMLRGYNLGEESIGIRRHLFSTLWAFSYNMKLNSVGLEQYIIQGKVLRNYRFDENNPCADGELAERLKEGDLPIAYLPYIFVWFNYLEKGRWSKNRFQVNKIKLLNILRLIDFSTTFRLLRYILMSKLWLDRFGRYLFLWLKSNIKR